MSAVMQSDQPYLYLPATRALPRRLSVDLSRGRYIYVYARPPGSSLYAIASADGRIDEAVMYTNWKPAALIVGGTHFHLTDTEAAEIERVFAPFGLRINRTPARS